MITPSYISLYKSGGLARRIDKLLNILKSCTLCPRSCKVNRLTGESGFCGAGKKLKIASSFPHFGEESPLVGRNGSGTIFLSYCNLLCSFCQNYDISHQGKGQKISSTELAAMMLALQRQGCHNINFVTPTHFTPQIISALPESIEMGLTIPIVWNCGGYESIEVIQLLDGIVDIYMPDAKFSDSKFAKHYANADNYFFILKPVLKEMFRQVGVLKINKNGAAYQGLLIRHLVMPNNVAGSKAILEFIAKELSLDSFVNIMSQYRPCYKAISDQLIGRAITNAEYNEVIEFAKELGLKRGFR